MFTTNCGMHYEPLIDELTILNKKINTLNVFLRFKVDTFQLIQVGTFQLI